MKTATLLLLIVFLQLPIENGSFRKVMRTKSLKKVIFKLFGIMYVTVNTLPQQIDIH